ncbi:MAG: ABC transporter substrate-binding protein [Anaerolineales bacterium]
MSAIIYRAKWSLVILLTACSSPSPSPTAAPVTSPAPSAPTLAIAPTATAVPTPLPLPATTPSVFTIGLAAAPGTLDPANAIDEPALLITRHLYEGLTMYAPGTTRAIPALAESWETSADGLTWAFRLRAGVRFSDGRPLTAEVAARNFERWLNRTPPGDYAFWRLMFGGFAGEADENGQPLSALAKVEAPDDQTLALTLSRPDVSLPNTLAMPSFVLVNPAAFESGDFTTPGAGTGPFVLNEWAGGITRLERNPGYWGTPAAPDELIFKTIPDDTQRLLALQTGEIEGMARLNPKDYAAARANPNLRVEFDPALEVLYLGFNQAHAPWSSLDCRLAVAYALNAPHYTQGFFPGDAEVAQAMQPPAAWGYAPPDRGHVYDPAQARQHWQACLDSGVTVPLTMTLYVPPVERPYLPEPARLGAAIQADLAAVSITVQIASPDWQTQWLPDVHTGRADLFVLGWVGVNGDPDSFLCPLFCGLEAAFHSDGKGNPLPPDPELAALLLSARSNPDPAQREALYAQAHARISETVPAIPLAHRQAAWAYHATVRGNIPSPIENVFFNLTKAATVSPSR